MKYVDIVARMRFTVEDNVSKSFIRKQMIDSLVAEVRIYLEDHIQIETAPDIEFPDAVYVQTGLRVIDRE